MVVPKDEKEIKSHSIIYTPGKCLKKTSKKSCTQVSLRIISNHSAIRIHLTPSIEFTFNFFLFLSRMKNLNIPYQPTRTRRPNSGKSYSGEFCRGNYFVKPFINKKRGVTNSISSRPGGTDRQTDRQTENQRKRFPYLFRRSTRLKI